MALCINAARQQQTGLSPRPEPVTHCLPDSSPIGLRSTFGWQRSYAVVARYVRRVIEEEGATVDSLAREIDFRVLAETAMRETRLTLYDPLMQSHLVPWVTIIGAVAAVIALFLAST
jgi:hypothetical protein